MNTDLMKRKATAFHEAGHAIIAAVKGVEVSELSIIARECCLGECEIEHNRHIERNFARFRAAIIELLTSVKAGGVAEEKYRVMSGLEISVESMRMATDYDDEYSELLKSMLIDQGDMQPIDFGCVRDDIESLLNTTEIWSAIANLADDLLSNNELNGNELFQHLVPFIPGGEWGGAEAQTYAIEIGVATS